MPFTRIDRLLVLSESSGVRCGSVFWLFRGTYRLAMPSSSVRIRYASCSLLSLTVILDFCGVVLQRTALRHQLPLAIFTLRAENLVCPNLDLEVGDAGSWDLWQELRGCVSNSVPVSAVPNAIRSSFPFIKRCVANGTNHADSDDQRAFFSMNHLWHVGGSTMLLRLQNLRDGAGSAEKAGK